MEHYEKFVIQEDFFFFNRNCETIMFSFKNCLARKLGGNETFFVIKLKYKLVIIILSLTDKLVTMKLM